MGLFRAVGSKRVGFLRGDARAFALENAHSDSLVGRGWRGPGDSGENGEGTLCR